LIEEVPVRFVPTIRIFVFFAVLVSGAPLIEVKPLIVGSATFVSTVHEPKVIVVFIVVVGTKTGHVVLIGVLVP
jgi:hypothetical protein